MTSPFPQKTTEEQGKRTRQSRTVPLVGVALLVFALIAGWQLYDYLKNRPAAQTGDKPAALLTRDDTGKPLEAKLFLALDYGVKDTVREDDVFTTIFTNLVIDQAKCLDYYGPEGIVQCKLNWNLLDPARQGWALTPSIPGGEWQFSHKNERYTAEYTYEKNNVKSGQTYTVRIPEKLGSNVLLASNKAQIIVNPFMPKITRWSFLTDPQNPKKRLVGGEVEFEWPVDRTSFESKVSLSVLAADATKKTNTAGTTGAQPPSGAPSAKVPGPAQLVTGKPVFSYSKDGKTAGITVAIEDLPPKSEILLLSIAPGVKRLDNEATSSAMATLGATVPGQDIFVSLAEATTAVATDNNMISRQVLTLEFTRPVRVSDVHASTRATLLPRYMDDAAQQRNDTARWSNYDITSTHVQNALTASQERELPLTPVPGIEEYSTAVSFSYSIPARYRHLDAPSGNYFYLDNAGGAASTVEYPLAPFSRIMEAPPLEKELRIMQRGNILSLNASKTLAILSRGLTHVKLDAWQVQPEYINLLARYSSTFPDSDLYHGIEFPDISRQVTLSYLPQKTDGSEPDYHAFNLSPLLEDGSKGLFRISLRGAGPDDNGGNGAVGEYNTYQTVFLLVTDLAMNIKKSLNGERQVFISSFASGQPCAGATVEVMGRNGLSVFAGTTDESGFVLIPDVDNFKKEKEPIALVARLGSDYTFMRLTGYEQDVSYDYDFVQPNGRPLKKDGLNAFAFAERGMFRPGEELRFGVIIKNSDWNTSALRGLPVRVQLVNPLGVTVYDKQHPQNDTGLTAISIPSQTSDPTGQYTLDVLLDKQWLGSTQVQVEEFQPDTLKVSTAFNKVPPTGRFKGWVLPENLALTVNVNNLYGTPAAGNKVNFFFTLTPVRLSFSEFSDYRFFDPGKDTRSYSSDLQSAVTDNDGQADFTINLESYASGSYRLSANAEAFEAGGGRSVTAYNNLLVSPHKVLVGWKSDAKLDFIVQDSQAAVEFIAVDNTLAPTALDNATIVISEVQYVSSLIKTDSGTFRYDTIRNLREIKRASAAISAEGLAFDLPTHTTGEFELNLLDEKGQERCNLNFVVAGGSQRVYGLERDVNLRIHLDKQEYNPGDEMNIFISAPYAGSGLITLESDRVLAHKWFTASTSDSRQTITVPGGFEGRAFVNVALVRDIHSDAVHSTPFTYAVAPFFANIEHRNQHLSLEAPEQAIPGETVRMTVKAAKPGKAIVFAVDEGILQLTAFKTPSALTHFLKLTPLAVTTRQNWDLIMPEYYLMNRAAFGGDAADSVNMLAEYLNPFRRKAEPSVAYWSGLIDVDENGTSLDYDVPSYFNGSLRIMAVSAGASSIGGDTRAVTVKGPLVISPDLPVAVAPGDEFEVTATIANNAENSGHGLDIAVEVELDRGLTFIRQPETAISVDEGLSGKAAFRLKATDTLGESTVKIKAKATVNGQDIIVERPVSLSIRPASAKISSFRAGFIKDKQQIIPVGRALYPQYAEVEASLSGLPLPLVDGLAGFLARFPHGCTEQILSSSFPYAVLNKTPELMAAPDGMTPSLIKERSEKAIQRGLVTLREREVLPGRFSLWPYESSGGYSFLTPYALDYLITAREGGFQIPQSMIDSAQAETLRLLQGTPQTQEAMRTMAYAAWVYTRSGKIYTDLPRLVKHLDASIKNWRSSPSAALIAACYQMMQQEKEATALINKVKAIDPNDKTDRRYEGWFFSRLWDNSLLLSMFSRHFPGLMDTAEARNALVHVINDTAAGDYTTASAAQGVRAIADYASAHMTRHDNLLLEARGKDGTVLDNEASGELVKRLSLGNEAHDFRFAGAKGLYWQISANGFDIEPQPAKANKLAVKAEYIPVRGQPLEELKQGDEVYVVLRASAAKTLDNVAITSLIPGGFEMVISKAGKVAGGESVPEYRNENLSAYAEYESDPAAASWNMDKPVALPNQNQITAIRAMLDEAGMTGRPMQVVHAERREDRMVVFTSLSQQESIFIFTIKAINKGTFTLPGTSASALYDPDARAQTSPGVIEVQ